MVKQNKFAPTEWYQISEITETGEKRESPICQTTSLHEL